jgi:hypothetical protein
MDGINMQMRWNFIASLINEKQFICGYEIGVERGDTYGYILNNCPTIKEWHGVDIWTPYKQYVTKSNGSKWPHDQYHQHALSIAKKHEGKAFIHRDYSENIAKEVEDESIDIVFIDADHTYEGVHSDILSWMPKVRKGGIICGHDYGLNPNGINRFPGVDRAVHELIGKENIKVGPDMVWWMEK